MVDVCLSPAGGGWCQWLAVTCKSTLASGYHAATVAQTFTRALSVSRPQILYGVPQTTIPIAIYFLSLSLASRTVINKPTVRRR